jgi:uncharacterized protein with NAD-binding domain and iron-sulfur cluster
MIASIPFIMHDWDTGYKPIVLEARDVLGGKVSAWQDKVRPYVMCVYICVCE